MTTAPATSDPSWRRVFFALLVGLIVLGTLLGAAYVARADDGPPPLAAPVDPLIPDLVVAPFTELAGSEEVATTQQFLRFGVVIANIGEGDLVVVARRTSFLADEWSTVQRIMEPTGDFTVRETDGQLIYAGDGHEHWHVRGVEIHRLETLDGTTLGEVVKQGYCFFDTTKYRMDLPAAVEEARYRPSGCGDARSSKVEMGLTVGWGDEYPWHMLQQQIEITDVPDGRYRLRAIADPNGLFEELDETNNEYWIELDIVRGADGFPTITQVAASEPA